MEILENKPTNSIITLFAKEAAKIKHIVHSPFDFLQCKVNRLTVVYRISHVKLPSGGGGGIGKFMKAHKTKDIVKNERNPGEDYRGPPRPPIFFIDISFVLLYA